MVSSEFCGCESCDVSGTQVAGLGLLRGSAEEVPQRNLYIVATYRSSDSLWKEMAHEATTLAIGK